MVLTSGESCRPPTERQSNPELGCLGLQFGFSKGAHRLTVEGEPRTVGVFKGSPLFRSNFMPLTLGQIRAPQFDKNPFVVVV
jgi:hypothetical protein